MPMSGREATGALAAFARLPLASERWAQSYGIGAPASPCGPETPVLALAGRHNEPKAADPP